MSKYGDLCKAWDGSGDRFRAHHSAVTAVARCVFQALIDELALPDPRRQLRYWPMSKLDEFNVKTDWAAGGAVEQGANGKTTIGLVLTLESSPNTDPKERVVIPVHAFSRADGEWSVRLGEDPTSYDFQGDPTPEKLAPVARAIAARILDDFGTVFERWRKGGPAKIGFV